MTTLIRRHPAFLAVGLALLMLSPMIARAATKIHTTHARFESLDTNRWTRKGYMYAVPFDSNRKTKFTVGWKTVYEPDHPNAGDIVKIEYFVKSGQKVVRKVTVDNGYSPPPPGAASAPSSPPPVSGGYTPPSAQTGFVSRADRAMNGTAEVTGSACNLRSGPGEQYAIVRVVYRGTELQLQGATGDWYLTALPDRQTGWIHGSLISIGGEAEPIARGSGIQPVPLEDQVTVGVLEFQSLNEEARKDQLGKMISEIFTTSLVNSRAFKIIEREQLNKVVKELELKQSGMVETAAEAGKLLGANAVITGSVMKIGNILRIDARIIDAKTALVTSAETNTGGYDLVEIGGMADKIVRNLVRQYYFE
jgi:TolB-like protein